MDQVHFTEFLSLVLVSGSDIVSVGLSLINSDLFSYILELITGPKVLHQFCVFSQVLLGPHLLFVDSLSRKNAIHFKFLVKQWLDGLTGRNLLDTRSLTEVQHSLALMDSRHLW